MCCCYNICKKALAISILSLIISTVVIILFTVFINKEPTENKDILVATAVSR